MIKFVLYLMSKMFTYLSIVMYIVQIIVYLVCNADYSICVCVFIQSIRYIHIYLPKPKMQEKKIM